jgi:hypothetical protein
MPLGVGRRGSVEQIERVWFGRELRSGGAVSLPPERRSPSIDRRMPGPGGLGPLVHQDHPGNRQRCNYIKRANFKTSH